MKRVLVAMFLFISAIAMVAAQVPVNLFTRGAQGQNGVVATAKPDSAQVGVDILKAGGNAVDAAVAVGFAQGVLEPNANGLGGGGFMTIKLAGMKEAVVIDFREMAPAAATPDLYKFGPDGKIIGTPSMTGGLASGVPGDVAGLLYALENYGSGKLTRQQVMQPAIDWAMKVPVTSNLAGAIKDNFDRIKMYPATAQIYFKDGLPYEIGDTIQNPDLQSTLKLIAASGAKAYYEGDLAKKIAAEVQARGGIITVDDLKNYKVQVRKPAMGTYRGYTIISTPPASSGGTHIVELLNILENWDMQALGQNTTKSLHLWGEAMKLVYADRAQYMADTAFVKVPLEGLTSKDYAKELAAKISLDKAIPLPVGPGNPSKYESGSTTSFSVMDKEGNMVACTKSINYFFGSAVVVPGTGIIMNDHMDDFALKPGSINSIEPGKRPLSSMSPTLVLDPQGRSFMTLGSAGATRIITSVAQIISNVIDHGMPIQQAISAPHVYRTNTTDYSVEGRIPVSAVNGLLALGHKIAAIQDDYSPSQGVAQGCLYDWATHTLYGGGDPRRDGQAVAF
ncbi:MAG: gamma-glutamyltransferase [Spirochaetes bacterium]|nr:gamma-glutamyltransferase [Spirochaetota bacterium]